MTAIPDHDPTRLLADLDFVRSLARQLCADGNDADDLAQETVRLALQQAPAGILSWRGWLATVVRNLAANRRRAVQRRAAHEAGATAPAGVPTPADVAAREELRHRVVAAVMALAEPFRAVVLLRHYRGLDTRDTARELGVPESTVRTRLKRAVAELRTRLDHEHGGDRARWRAGLLPFVLPDGRSIDADLRAPAPAVLPATWVATLAAIATVVVVAWFWRATDPTPQPPPYLTRTAAAAAANDRVAGGGDAASRASERNTATTAAAPAPGAGRYLRATVKDGSGAPFAGAEIAAWFALGGREEPIAARIGNTRTGSDGTAVLSLAGVETFSPLAREELVVVMRADANGCWPQTASVDLAELPDPSSIVELTAGLHRANLVKGRVVAPDGQPVPRARVALVQDNPSAEAAIDGSFALQVPEPPPVDGLVTLVASHPSLGFCAPARVVVATTGDTRAGELVLDRALGVLTGVVLFADGEPAGNVEMCTHRHDDGDTDPARAIADVLGLAVTDFDAAFASPWDHPRVFTDAAGRFVFRNLKPGRYTVGVEREEDVQCEATVGTTPVDVVLTYATDGEPAQVHVLIEDRDGRRLQNACYVTYRWYGDAATAAARDYERRGATPALLQSVQVRDGSNDSRDEWSPAEPDSFVLFAASSPGSDIAHGGCHLAPGQRRGNVRIVLEPRRETGTVQVVLRDPDGHPLPRVWARFSPDQGERAVPVLLAGLVANTWPPSRIADRWHEVPAGGRVAALPTGTLFVELLAARAGAGGRLQWPLPIARGQVTVRKGEVATLDVTCEQGLQLELELRASPPGRDERLSLGFPKALVHAEGSAFPNEMHLAASDGSRNFGFADGRCRVRLQGLAAGHYTVELRVDVRRERFEPAHGNTPERWVDAGSGTRVGKVTVTLAANTPTVVVDLDPH